jgi:hypothetical protein
MTLNQLFRIILVCFCANFTFGQGSGFTINQGQFHDQFGNALPDLHSLCNTNNLSVQLYDDHFSYEIKVEDEWSEGIRKGVYKDWASQKPFQVHYSRVEFYFGGEANDIRVNDPLKTYTNYINPLGSFYEVLSYEEVTYVDLYDQIDLEFISTETGPKYNFVLKAGADIEDIELEIKGGQKVFLANEQLHIETQNGELVEEIPLSFIRTFDGLEREVEVNYVLEGRKLKFELEGDLSVTDELIIDPIPDIIWGTYTGGPNNEFMEAVGIDNNNHVVSSGFSSSTSSIATSGAYDETFDGVFDISLMKFDESGNKLWGTYFGGDGYDRVYGLDISNDNNIYITGNTFSADMATPGVHQEFQVNGDEVIVAKFTGAGVLVWSTYYGGDQHDFGAVIAVDADNNSYITGHTYSTTLIATAGMYKEVFSGASNAYVAKFDDLGVLDWATYYGEQLEEGWGIGLDADANVYISGGTQSSFGIATPGTHQLTFGGYNDAFLAKWDTDGDFQWGTYYGDAPNDQSYGLTVDREGYAYMTGITSSSTAIAYGDVYQPTQGSLDDGFLAKFRPNGTLVWGTYIGGEGADYAYAVDMGADSNLVVAGMTLSSEDIAKPSAYDDSWEGLYDGFVISIDSTGDYRFGTYYGGPAHDEPRDVDVSDADLKIVISGTTASNSGLTTPGADEELYPGGTGDTFLAKFCNPIFPDIEITSETNVICDNKVDTIYITDPGTFSSIVWSTLETTDFVTTEDFVPGDYVYYVDAVDTNGCSTASDTLNLVFFEADPVPVFGDKEYMCYDDTIQIWTDSGYVAYDWVSGGTDTLDLYYGFDEAGDVPYWVNVTDTNGCIITSDTGWVEILPIPDATITLLTSGQLCEGDTIEVSVAENDEILWNNSEETAMTEYSWASLGDYEISVITTTDSGCVAYDTITVTIEDCDVGIDETAPFNLFIYPNPASDYLVIESEKALTLSIYSTSGQLVRRQDILEEKGTKIDLQTFSSGIYTFSFGDGEYILNKKVVITK